MNFSLCVNMSGFAQAVTYVITGSSSSVTNPKLHDYGS